MEAVLKRRLQLQGDILMKLQMQFQLSGARRVYVRTKPRLEMNKDLQPVQLKNILAWCLNRPTPL